MSTTLASEHEHELAAAPDLESVAERILGDTVTFAEHLSAWLGLDLGLYASMQNNGPVSAKRLASDVGIAPRYAREWLEQQTVAGYLICVDPTVAADERLFELPSAVAGVLLEPDSGAHLGPLLGMARELGGLMGRVADAYRTGEGIPYTDYGDRFRHGIGGLNGPTFDTQLASWLAELPDVDRTLRTTAAPRILDLGCGVGRSAIALARAYPRATVRGVDLDPASIADARAAAAAAGLAHRVTFDCADAARLPADTTYDLVTIFEALHDMGDPVGTLRAARSVLAPGSSVYVADERVEHEFTPDADIVERMQYAFSVLHCLPATMAEDPEIANGTVLRMPTLVDWASVAGFDHVEDLEVDDPFWRHYRLTVRSGS
jgi:SAM-dependent methyltransferase